MILNSKLFKQVRLSNKISKNQLAKRSNIDINLLCDIESNSISHIDFYKIRDVFKILDKPLYNFQNDGNIQLINTTPKFEKLNIMDFIYMHPHIRYCEAIIYPDGDISYAVPSHMMALEKIIDKEQLDIISNNEHCDPLIEMINYTGCICMWYDNIHIPNIITKEQNDSINLLRKHKLINI